ncbi:hypothetical protein PR048_012021 [Dryococelus australis]|uniref:L1 transposable element RRM domain-containing protein n=1 Tax=Dryococelus australis TaxID=614101 RepID=A0ABQ9HNZ2_9NEOP|nr:hypothetical protein PR048_012021 [Dryococelus australis]
MTAKQVEMRQLEQLVQDLVKEFLTSKEIVSVIVEAVMAAVSEAVICELKEIVLFNQEETNKLREDLWKIEESLREAKHEHFFVQDELEQYQRRSNLRVLGIPESEIEDNDAIVFDVMHNKLQLPHVNISDIDRSHHVGAKNEGKPRPIIVKFTSYRRRNEVFRAKCFLAKSGVTIHENLKKECLALLNADIAKYGLHNVWTTDGRIVVKSCACHFEISRSEELKTPN